MRRDVFSAVKLSCTFAAACALALGTQSAAAETIAIVHAQAWTMTGADGGKIDDATCTNRRSDSCSRCIQLFEPLTPARATIDFRR